MFCMGKALDFNHPLILFYVDEHKEAEWAPGAWYDSWKCVILQGLVRTHNAALWLSGHRTVKPSGL